MSDLPGAALCDICGQSTDDCVIVLLIRPGDRRYRWCYHCLRGPRLLKLEKALDALGEIERLMGELAADGLR